MADLSNVIAEQVRDAHAGQTALEIVAGGTKRSRGRAADGARLEVGQHAGLVSYEPNELVLVARAGTRLAEIAALLDENRQRLAFEPPGFGAAATLGGTLACNVSGPRRPWSGAMRDAVLGVKLIDGTGKIAAYGGKVMKNVAGFDVSRLQAGAFGAFGVVTEVSLKVLPKPASTLTLVEPLDAEAALERMSALAASPKPLTGASWHDGSLYLRLEGAESAVSGTAAQWGGERLPDDATYWRDLAELRLPFFGDPEPLWRFSVRPTAELPDLGKPWLIDWCGAQRYVHGNFDAERMMGLAEAAGGHVSLLRGGDRDGEVHHRLPRALEALHLRLKQTFDPGRILNPGRLYSWL